MDLTEDEVHRIIRIIDTLQYGDIDLEYGDLKISIQRGDVQPNSDFPPRENIRQGAPRSTSEFEAALQAPEPRSADDGFHEVRSPVNGIFFSAPSPGAPTFVEIGSTVGPEDPVCLVEVMKLFNHRTGRCSRPYRGRPCNQWRTGKARTGSDTYRSDLGMKISAQLTKRKNI